MSPNAPGAITPRFHPPDTSSRARLPKTGAASGRDLFPSSSPEPDILQPRERPSKRTRFDFEGEAITVLVGGDEQHYWVHKRAVCTSSDFFQETCSRNLKEGKEDVVHLPGVEPDIFRVYLCWVYTGEVDLVTESTDTHLRVDKYKHAPDTETTRKMLDLMTNLFVLGDRLQDIAFKNAVVDEFVAFVAATGKIPSPDAVHFLWAKRCQKSTLVKAYVDVVVVRANPNAFISMADKYPTGFVVEMAKAGMRDRDLSLDRRGPTKRGRCFYHEHKGGKGTTKFCSRSTA